jgi:DNA-binding HxlR family transcriptional regulator
MTGPYGASRGAASTTSVLAVRRGPAHHRGVDVYGQYCPVAVATEVIGDRWTPLIVRELVLGSTRFNEIQRGIPRVSRTLLSGRLQRMERFGIIERSLADGVPHYTLTAAGEELGDVLRSLGEWAVRWSFGDPRPEQADPFLLLWRMRQRVRHDRVPAQRITIQFDFTKPRPARAWMVLDHDDATVCIQDPGYDVDLWVSADTMALERVWMGRTTLAAAVQDELVRFEGPPRHARNFRHWFAWSPFHDVVAAYAGGPERAPVTDTGHEHHGRLVQEDGGARRSR